MFSHLKNFLMVSILGVSSCLPLSAMEKEEFDDNGQQRTSTIVAENEETETDKLFPVVHIPEGTLLSPQDSTTVNEIAIFHGYKFLYEEPPLERNDIALSEITAGNKHLEKCEFQDAATQYDLAIQKIMEAGKPVPSILYEMAALAYYQAQNYPKALSYYQNAKEVAPSPKLCYPQNYFHLAQCYYMEHMPKESLKEFKLGFSISTAPLVPFIYIAAAQPAMDLNEWELAAAWFKEAITKDEQQAAIIYADAGYAFLMIHDNAQALEYLNKALELNPGLPQRVHDRREIVKIRLSHQS